MSRRSSRHPFLAFAGGSLLSFALVACSSTPPVASGAPQAGGSASVAPSVGSAAPSTDTESPAPSRSAAAPSSSPASTAAPAVWSKPETVPGLDGCVSAVLAVDDSGSIHIAADCRHGDLSEIRYAVSAGGAWTTDVLPVPAHRLERLPQLAFSGSTLYLAYTRLAPVDGGCGADGLQDVGVYVRSRSLPNGTWSDARLIGVDRDELESFRVSNGMLYATVANEKDGRTYFETGPVEGAVAHRVQLPNVAGATSLRVGDDGVARVAFEGASGLQFGTVDANAALTKPVPGTSGGWAPSLVLSPGNNASLLWSLSYHGAGCASPDPSPADGTYFSTNVGGAWQTQRISKMVGESSLTVDPASGDVH
ncbi:MAG TPA: hypothetical protein VFP22_00995, partial [Candidatus Limnocylindrales bacterium]|nr:hypothetical protein [Candidatus Limnocylindrales bacterium]